MSCFVLDRSVNDQSMFDMSQQQNNTFHVGDARSNFMPSIARKPFYVRVMEEKKKVKLVTRHTFLQEESNFEDDPDFQLREMPSRVGKQKMMNHFYPDDRKQ